MAMAVDPNDLLAFLTAVVKYAGARTFPATTVASALEADAIPRAIVPFDLRRDINGMVPSPRTIGRWLNERCDHYGTWMLTADQATGGTQRGRLLFTVAPTAARPDGMSFETWLATQPGMLRERETLDRWRTECNLTGGGTVEGFLTWLVGDHARELAAAYAAVETYRQSVIAVPNPSAETLEGHLT